MIAPINTGQQTDLKPWLIPDDAFELLYDAYVFRGRVRKRFGSYLMNQSVAGAVAPIYSRLSIQLPNTDPITGNASGTVPGKVFQPGQMFAIGDQMYTVQTTGTPVAMLNTGVGTGTYDTSNGNYVITGAAALDTPVYFFPATPVMGFIVYEDDMINNEPVYAFDTQFSYQYITGRWIRLTGSMATLPGANVWTGSDSQFMWGYTYRGLSNSDYYLFVTNFNAPDFLRYWDGVDWHFFYPILNGLFRLITARLVVPFKDRLIYLNTVESNEGIQATNGATNATDPVTGSFTGIVPGYVAIGYKDGQKFLVGTTVYSVASSLPGPQAMTVTTIYTTSNPNSPTPPTATFNVSTGDVVIVGNGNNPKQNVYFLPNNSTPQTGNQFNYVNRCRYSQNGNPISPNAFVDTIGGKGGYIDAATKEQIVSCEFLKDRLIVYFEKSTWELVYTGNEILPFRWQQINTELGAEATFSTVPFDKVVLGIGNVGVHACNGSNVERIDNNIPNDVFDIENNNEGVFRVYGIRDFFVEMVYWTFPDDEAGSIYPNRVLTYNYKTGAWAFNRDSITAFGYWQSQGGVVWLNNLATWEESIEPWNSGTLQSHFRQVIAGNQEGFIFVIDTESTRNAPALQISNMTFNPDLLTLTVVNHNLSPEDPDFPDYIVIENAQGVTGVNDLILPVYSVLDVNNFTIKVPAFAGVYKGGGTIARVSNIDIYTKQYNFYVNQGVNANINKVDLYLYKTSD